MIKPDTLLQLLDELQEENIRSEVEVTPVSKAIIYLNDEAAEAEDGIELSSKECLLVFAGRKTVERLADALDTCEASITLVDVTMPHATLEELERNFVAVDES